MPSETPTRHLNRSSNRLTAAGNIIADLMAGRLPAASDRARSGGPCDGLIGDQAKTTGYCRWSGLHVAG